MRETRPPIPCDSFMNKLIHIIWGVLTYREPFDPNGGVQVQKAAQNAV